MKPFARLIERLAFTPGRNARLTILRSYFSTTPDPDRGWALAALAGEVNLSQVTPALLKSLAARRVDAELFALSYDFVGDLAETIALIWPAAPAGDPATEAAPADGEVPPAPPAAAPLAFAPLPATGAPEAQVGEEPAGPGLSAVVQLLRSTPKAALPEVIAGLLDQLGPSERLALLKLGTGNLRVGVSQRLALQALAGPQSRSLDEITEVWSDLAPPYAELFSWLAGGPAPPRARAAFRPVMLSTPLEEGDFATLNPGDYFAEWKWDGIRVQASCEAGVARLYSRRGEEISAAFPDLLEALDFEGTLDGELLVRRDAEVAPFADLQKRLGRKTLSRAMRESHPAALRVYDLLSWQGEDLRSLPLEARRARLESLSFASPRLDLSPLVPFASWEELAELRAAPPSPVIEGIMLKRRDSAYLAGRPRGPWFKWKRTPTLIDAVLLYAQAGHGKRSGFYSDFTFGLWKDDALVPVGKAYSGFTDEELRALDRFVRKNTTQRFGPVRQLAPELVVEVAFEGVAASARHKSGVALRFPRIARIRWDKPAAEADHLSALEALL